MNTSKILIFIFYFLFFHNEGNSQNFILQKNEKSEYRIHYGLVEAGKFTLQVDSVMHTIDSMRCFKVHAIGKTIGSVNLVADIEDHWVSYMDSSKYFPYQFVRKIKENNFKKNEINEFDRKRDVVLVSTETNNGDFAIESYNVPKQCHDIISSYYFLRAINFDKSLINDTIRFNVFLENKFYNAKVLYLGKQILKSAIGKFKVFVIAPIIPKESDSMFRNDLPITAYITDDKFRIPLKISAKLVIGAVEVDISYSNHFLKKKKVKK